VLPVAMGIVLPAEANTGVGDHGSRWRRDGYSVPGNGAHGRRRRKAVWRRPPNPAGTTFARKLREL
jgi:hypothetical protein